MCSITTVRNCCGKVMFLHLSISHSVHAWQGGAYMGGGMHGRGQGWGVCGRGVCMAGGHVWRGCTWQGACMAGGVCGRGACMAREVFMSEEMATAVYLLECILVSPCIYYIFASITFRVHQFTEKQKFYQKYSSFCLSFCDRLLILHIIAQY